MSSILHVGALMIIHPGGSTFYQHFLSVILRFGLRNPNCLLAPLAQLSNCQDTLNVLNKTLSFIYGV